MPQVGKWEFYGQVIVFSLSGIDDYTVTAITYEKFGCFVKRVDRR